MTYRERREAKAERLREWADKREEKAAAVFEANRPYTSDHAFNTQPGHIPARARIIRQEDRQRESLVKAEDMRRRADGIDAAAAHAIYSDDPDALDALRARIDRLEAEREQIKAENAAYRKAHRAELAGMTAYQRDQAMPHPAYRLQNLTGNIKRNRDRLAQLERQAERLERTEAAGGTLVEYRGEGRYAVVTFAEKPAREVLDALKAAGYRWSRPSWIGETDRLPEGIAS